MEKKLEMLEERMEEHLKELGLELADIEYVPEGGYNYLRIYVEKPDGNTSLDDCVELSTRIDGIADELINEKFYLEVSTPGLERRLKKPKDFTRFTGKKEKEIGEAAGKVATELIKERIKSGKTKEKTFDVVYTKKDDKWSPDVASNKDYFEMLTMNMASME